ncbi:MAG: M1 family aminopeptidase [Erythrobacter sp.]|nr:M1 family aminopeptidase [Erythrobacter sp.]
MRILLFLLAFLLAASMPVPGSKVGAATSNASPATIRILVEPAGERFRATFSFPQSMPVWAFHRSQPRRSDGQPWRADAWQVVTPGVSIQRVGAFDTFVGENGAVPRRVVIEFAPPAIELIAAYDPALVFTDGTTAIYGGAFTVFPGLSREQIEALDRPQGARNEIVFVNGPEGVFYRGMQRERAVDDGNGYAIFARVDVEDDAGVATLLDPGLPTWLANGLREDTPRVFEFYRERIGPHASDRPLVLASWVPSDLPGIGLGGSALPGMITMRFEGTALQQSNPQTEGNALWFIAHEAAHFWLGETVRYDDRDRMWITEGGADLMAMRATERLFEGFSAEPMIEQAKAACAAALAEAGVESPQWRTAVRPYYDCGSLFALAVEAAGEPRGEDFFDFVAELISSENDGVVDKEDWLAAARRFGLAPEKIALIRRMLSEASANPARDIDLLLASPNPEDSIFASMR